MNTIAEQWEVLAATMPEGAPPVQVQEMRRAFYAGAAALLRLQHNIGDVSDAAGVMMFEGWHDECSRFYQMVLEGKA